MNLYPHLVFYPLLVSGLNITKFNRIFNQSSNEANITSSSSSPGVSFISYLLLKCEAKSPLTAAFATAIEMIVAPDVRLRDFYLQPIARLARHAQQTRGFDEVPKLSISVEHPVKQSAAVKKTNPFGGSRGMKPPSINNQRSESPVSAAVSNLSSSVQPEFAWEDEIGRRWREMWRICFLTSEESFSLLGREHRIFASRCLEVRRHNMIDIDVTSCSICVIYLSESQSCV